MPVAATMTARIRVASPAERSLVLDRGRSIRGSGVSVSVDVAMSLSVGSCVRRRCGQGTSVGSLLPVPILSMQYAKDGRNEEQRCAGCHQEAADHSAPQRRVLLAAFAE